MRLLLCLLYIPAMGILAHMVGEALPRRWFNPEAWPFAPFKFERNGRIYDKIGVRFWKDKLPDMSKAMPDMTRKSVSMSGGSAQAENVARETCVAETVHWVLMLLSWIIYRIYACTLGAVIAIVYALSHIPFIIIQRYNRPTLTLLAKRLKQREERILHENTDTVG